MNEQDKTWWAAFRESDSNTITAEEYDKVCELHANYFNHKLYKPCTCNSKKVQRWITDLNKIYLGD